MLKALNVFKVSIVVFDRGDFSYSWFRRLGEKGIFFVTRLKRDAVYTLLERRPVSRKSGVTFDPIIEVAIKGKPLRLRRVGYRAPETGNHYEFLTNHLRLSARTIADIYKDRWQIEIFSGKSSRIYVLRRLSATQKTRYVSSTIPP